MTKGMFFYVLTILIVTNFLSWNTGRAYEAALMVGERIEMKKQEKARLKVIRQEEHFLAFQFGDIDQERKELSARSKP